MLSLNKINVDIGPVGILKNASLNLNQGEMIGLIGRNGAGKTTFLKLLFGLINPTEGAVIKNYNESEIKKSFVFQSPIFLDRTVEENLKHTLYCKNISINNWDKIII
mgnify:CR=1 FL=1